MLIKKNKHKTFVYACENCDKEEINNTAERALTIRQCSACGGLVYTKTVKSGAAKN